MFKSCQNKGFHMTFANGLTISVQFGPFNYCDQRSTFPNARPEDQEIWKSGTAEIGIWNSEGWKTNQFINCHGDDVIGHLTADQVAELIYKVSTFNVT